MKIAIIDPSLFTWPYDTALAQGLAGHGHEVALFTKYLLPGEQGKNAPNIRELFYPGFQHEGMKKLPHPVFLALKGLSHPFSLLRLLRALRRFKPDVIHFQWAPLPVIDRLFIPAFRKIAPVVLTVHDSSPFNGNPSSRIQQIGAIAIMKRFDRLIVHTGKARAALIRYGLDESRIARIPHGLLGTGMTNVAAPASEKPGDGPVTFLLFGKLKPYKGADILIRALADMPAESRAKTRIHIAGQAQMETQALFDLARDLKVADHIAWDLRFVDDAEMAAMFGKADVTVMPYREIDASGVLMVALSAGRPILASRIGLFSELLEDGRHGYLVPPEDPAALARAMAAMVNDPPGLTAMGAAVRALQADIPGWNDIAAMTEDLYRGIA